MHLDKTLSLLIDVGTNGEVVLGNSEWLAGCSCSAGPAFEGGEVACGMRATSGAIERARIIDNGDVKYSTIGRIPPRGICGSGLIDIISEMFSRGIIDKGGKLVPGSSTRVRDNADGKEFLVVPADETSNAKDLVISETDIRNIIRTKAAVYSACATLVRKLDYNMKDIERIYIAGGFGNYLDMEKAVTLGLLPDVPRDRFRFIGNGALGGARLCLLSKEKYLEADGIVKKMTYIDLSTDALFFEEYQSALFLPHTDIGRFPSVRAGLGHRQF
jgi:uncharacterized 2Fe-2S/4Fe-4S cluster protein (DUF4445 family)